MAKQDRRVQPQLSQKQKRLQIQERLLAAPEVSDRAIAKGLGVSHITVRTVRRELLELGHIEPVTTSAAADWLNHPYIRKNPDLLSELNERGLYSDLITAAPANKDRDVYGHGNA
jgi:IS30 family transposase